MTRAVKIGKNPDEMNLKIRESDRIRGTSAGRERRERSEKEEKRAKEERGEKEARREKRRKEKRAN